MFARLIVLWSKKTLKEVKRAFKKKNKAYRKQVRKLLRRTKKIKRHYRKIYKLYNKKLKKTKFFKETKKLYAQNPRIYKLATTGVLSITLVAAILYLVFPFLPEIVYGINPPNPRQITYNVTGAEERGFEVTENSVKIPDENRLIIPAIDVDTRILEGSDLSVLDREEGVWRDPKGKNPSREGNTTIAGHRFQYLPPNTTTFYNLNKVRLEDMIIVFWEGEVYYYKIYDIFIAFPDQVEIKEDSDKMKEITIYTCAPLGSNTRRLVVKAEIVP